LVLDMEGVPLLGGLKGVVQGIVGGATPCTVCLAKTI
jgi:hypothetical protein